MAHDHDDHTGHHHAAHAPHIDPSKPAASAHHHRHTHISPDAGDKRVAAAVAVNLILTVAQIIGGILSGSIALIADAIHNLSDALSLIIAFAARRIARRPATPAMSFGYGRAEIVAALVNYTTLIVISVWLGYAAIERLFNPPEVTGWIVIVLAGIALLVNSATALLTWAMAKHSMNIRAAFLHNLSDAGTSLAVIVGGVLIMLYDWRLVDPLITLGISIWILIHALTEVGPVIRILMLAAPDGLETSTIRLRLAGVPGVSDLHHLHLWQIDEKRSSFEAHVVLTDDAIPAQVARNLKSVLATEFGLTHVTLELETVATACGAPTCQA